MLDWDKNNPNKQTNKSYQKDVIKIEDKSEKVDCWEIMELLEKQEINDYIVDRRSLTVSVHGLTKAKRVILYPMASPMKNTR